MASVYRKKRYATVPANAEVVASQTRAGKVRRVAHWADDDCKLRRAEVHSHPRFGDRIVVGEQKKWYIAYQSERGRKYVVGYTDKAASIALGKRLEQEAARRHEGLIDRYDDHARIDINEHLKDFLESRPSHAVSERYRSQFQRRIERIICGVSARRLQDLDPVKINQLLNGLELGGHAHNEYVGNIKAFTKWAVEVRRLREDPLASLRKIPRKKINPEHPRRALSPEEIGRLLEVAEFRPLEEVRKVRTGNNKGEFKANVRPRVRRKMLALGSSRRLAYLIAIWTGLRRSEIEQLRWSDIDLDNEVPVIRLRAQTTKSRRGDQLALHPQLVRALREARPGNNARKQKVVSSVPDMKAFRADLEKAGIDPGNAETGFVDFHALRKSLGTMMAVAGMSQRSRQSHMRHTDPRLTENTYMDERLLPVATELSAVPPIPMRANASDTDPTANRATHMQHITATRVLFMASDDTESQDPDEEMVVKGPRSKVLLLQAVGQLMSTNDKASHRLVRGLLESG
jgi:integrase